MSTLGDIGTVAAPTVVAVTALWFNNRQQATSRKHDRIERKKERDHDRAMREAAERHERQLSDLDYQRRLVDDVVAAMDGASDAVLGLWTHWKMGYQEDEGNTDETDACIERVSTADDALKVAKARMILRFGADHEAVSIVHRATAAVQRAWLATVSQEHQEKAEKAKTTGELNAAYTAVKEAVDAFLALTGGIVGSAPERS